MTPELTLLLLDLAGTFAFAVNGALVAMRMARVDVVGVVTLGTITAMGGGIIRDVLAGSLPPTTFSDWRYLATAGIASLLAFALGRWLERFSGTILTLDALGLSLFAVTGAAIALDLGLGPGQSVLLGAISAVGGGTLRDVMVGRVPTVLSSDLYAVPALLASLIVVVTSSLEVYGLVAALVAASACFTLRMVGVRYGIQAPRPRHSRGSDED